MPSCSDYFLVRFPVFHYQGQRLVRIGLCELIYPFLDDLSLDLAILGHSRHLQQELKEERDEGLDQGHPGGVLHLPGPHHKFH